MSLNKSVDERVEDINETVRRTDVEVENLGSGDAARAGNGRNSGAAGTTGNTLAGLGNEAIGNVKQGLGSVTGNDNLERSGEAQEREGEAQQGKTPGGY